ncbi:transcriptional regulator [Streptomyces sp. NPDC050617]|uniref:transcriptional regulator n=1 Tax=Streptomyces sp. NPDC050617 TaxID=3154628 RepID=UPI00342E5FDC
MPKFSRPPKADENYDLVSKRLKEAQEPGKTPETVTVEWNENPLHVGVIEVPLRNLYYNPDTHRIRAQSSQKPDREKLLRSSPWIPESQEYLYYLLRGKPANPDEDDPDFVALRDSLKEVGQREPGLITHEGILVNGNTRAAAMRQLKRTSIRVGVLPPSFTWEDINQVELALQLRPDKRREYSYINRLLAMEEQELAGRAGEDIARDFHVQFKTFKQERWILEVIRDLIERSQTEAGSRLRMVDFEGHQENLKELHRAYVKAEKSRSRDHAELIKESRMAAIILDFAKTRTRLIDDAFHERYLAKTLPADLKPVAEPEAAPSVIPGLSVSVSGPSVKVAEVRAFTDSLLRAKATEGADGLPSEKVQDARDRVVAARKSMRRSLDLAYRDESLRKTQQTAAERLDDARAAIEQSISDLAQARSSQDLDEEGFDDAVLRLKASLAKLARQAVRGLAEPGDGVNWLTEAVMKGQG